MILLFLFLNFAQAQDANQFWPTGIKPCIGCKENDESFPTYDDAIGKNNSRCYDKFEDRRMDRMKKTNRMKPGKKQDEAIDTEILCEYTRFQACAGLERKTWNLYFKGDFRKGIKRGCLWK